MPQYQEVEIVENYRTHLIKVAQCNNKAFSVTSLQLSINPKYYLVSNITVSYCNQIGSLGLYCWEYIPI